MEPFENKRLLKERAREMRKNMTPQEGKLWHLFLKTYPVPFRRQVVIGGYITDFFCRRARLAIEIDGSQHYLPEYQAYDMRRTHIIEAQDIMLVRFTNREVDHDIENIKFFIHYLVKLRIRTMQTPTLK